MSNKVLLGIKELNWPRVKKHLDQEMLDSESLEKLLAQVRQSSSLIIKHSSEKQTRERDLFLGRLAGYCEACLGADGRRQIDREIALLKHIERGYQLILRSLADSDISKRAPEQRLSAYINRTTRQYCLIMNRLADEISKREEIVHPYGLQIEDEGQQSISPDGVINALTQVLTNSIQMEAYINDWFDEDGVIAIPPISPSSDDDIEKAGVNESCALSWHWWQKAEERRRYMGGEMEILEPPNLPTGAPEGVKSITFFRGPSGDVFDFLSNIRLNSRIGQTYQELYLRSRRKSFESNIFAGTALPPDSFVSLDEAHATIVLSEILGYNIVLDDSKAASARITEWLRGYAVLQSLARGCSNTNDPNSLTLSISQEKLVSIFLANGICSESIPIIIQALTLRKRSRDLFDCPLLQLNDGSMLLFIPGMINANLTRIVLSILSEQKASLGSKGKAFENSMLDYLRSHKLRADSFEINLDEEYEYDVLLLWDTHLFIFECKNHSLSNRNPIHAYRILQELQSNVRQVKRLEQGMKKHSVEIGNRLNVNIDEMKIVPCVLNSLPYSLPGNYDGVYFTDASALHRFFNERNLHVQVPYEIDGTTFLYRIALQSLWKNDKPTPEDLVAFLEKPIPLEFAKAHTECRQVKIPLGNGELGVIYDYHQREVTIESIAEFSGACVEDIKAEIDEFLKHAKSFDSRLSEKSE